MEVKPSQDRENNLGRDVAVIKVGLTLLEYQDSKLGAAGKQDQIVKSFAFLAREFRYYPEVHIDTLKEMINVWALGRDHLFEDSKEIIYKAPAP